MWRTIKGQGNEVALYEVLWQTEDVTSMVPAIALKGRETRRALRLRWRCGTGKWSSMSTGRSVAIGRAEDNDLIVKGNLISRLHARIELSRNRFVLIDQSTNGTFVQILGGEESFVRRDSMQVKGKGMIGLGRTARAGLPRRRYASSARRI